MATPTRKITLQPVETGVEASHDTFSHQKLGVTSLAEQHKRQRIRDDWEPKGFERYQYQRGLLHSMNVLGTIAHDEQLPEQRRFEPVSPCVESLECTCKGPYE